MQNYLQPGHTLSLAAPYAVASGGGALIGSIFGVAKTALALNAVGAFEVEGCFTLPKDGNAIALGAKVYWDNTNKVVTATATSNTLIGVAIAARVAGDTSVGVRLNGTFL